jgi:hypothetical protein
MIIAAGEPVTIGWDQYRDRLEQAALLPLASLADPPSVRVCRGNGATISFRYKGCEGRAPGPSNSHPSSTILTKVSKSNDTAP